MLIVQRTPRIVAVATKSPRSEIAKLSNLALWKGANSVDFQFCVADLALTRPINNGITEVSIIKPPIKKAWTLSSASRRSLKIISETNMIEDAVRAHARAVLSGWAPESISLSANDEFNPNCQHSNSQQGYYHRKHQERS